MALNLSALSMGSNGWISKNTPVQDTGAIQTFGYSAPPSGWLVCDGSEVSRTLYANLFAQIGTQYGAGDGSTTFNLPSLSGLVGRWIDAGQMTITATTTNPTKATVRENDSVRWRQVGENYEVEYRYRAASAAGAVLGSGDYLFHLPVGLEFNSTVLKSTSLGSNLFYGDGSVSTIDTTGITSAATISSSGDSLGAVPFDDNKFKLRSLTIYSVANTVGSTYYHTENPNLVYQINIKFRGKQIPQSITCIKA